MNHFEQSFPSQSPTTVNLNTKCPEGSSGHFVGAVRRRQLPDFILQKALLDEHPLGRSPFKGLDPEQVEPLGSLIHFVGSALVAQGDSASIHAVHLDTDNFSGSIDA